jgi:putative ABC transport system ATP-binding protein
MYHVAPHQNPLAVGADEWIDYQAAGASGPDDIDDLIIEVLRIVGMDEAIYRFGLGQAIDPARDPALAQRFVEARRALDEVLTAEQAKELIESFHPDRYNRNATIGENLVFGVARDSGLAEGNLIDHAAVRAVLDQARLTVPLARMGLRIAEIMVEIFSDVSGDNFLIEQFSFIQIGDLPAYEEIITRVRARGAEEPDLADAQRLVALALMYVEPRHRLGLLTQDLEERIVRARADFRASMALGGDAAIEFYDPDRYCAAAPLRDNLLFGRVTYGVPGAAERVLNAVRRVLEARGLDREIYRLGLKQQTGPGGRLLFPSQRAAIALARCLIKRPDVLILNQAMSAFGDVEGKEILRRIKARMEGRTLIVLARDSETATLFDLVVALQEGKIKSAGTPAAAVAAAQASGQAASPQAEQGEVKALRAIPMFADIETARLKLIALASERVHFAAGQTIFRQGAASDSAYIILEGGADALLETPAGPIHLSHVHANSVVGEMGVINGAPRSATVVTTTETTALHLSRDVLLGLLSEFPQIALALMRDLIRRLVAANALIARASGMGEGGAPIESSAPEGGGTGEENRA